MVFFYTKGEAMIIDTFAKWRANYIHDILIQHLFGNLLNSRISFFDAFFIKNPEKDGAIIEYRLEIEGKQLVLTIHVPDEILCGSIAKMMPWITEKITQISVYRLPITGLT